MISDEETCSFCADRSRDHSAICVVESVRDVMSIENTGQYHGVYHVLGGIISPIAGIGPSDLSIPELVRRVEALEDPAGAEVIFALSGDVEGESTDQVVLKNVNEVIRDVLELTGFVSYFDFE